jgi:hypothetical protein
MRATRLRTARHVRYNKTKAHTGLRNYTTDIGMVLTNTFHTTELSYTTWVEALIAPISYLSHPVLGCSQETTAFELMTQPP